LRLKTLTCQYSSNASSEQMYTYPISAAIIIAKQIL